MDFPNFGSLNPSNKEFIEDFAESKEFTKDFAEIQLWKTHHEVSLMDFDEKSKYFFLEGYLINFWAKVLTRSIHP